MPGAVRGVDILVVVSGYLVTGSSMPHVIEPATSGRAKCRGCGTPIAKGELRLGEAVPNLYADTDGAETTHWYHPVCAAFRRPEAFLLAVESTAAVLPERDRLVAAAQLGTRCHRVPRLDGAGRAPSGRAACRACKTPIPKGQWRLSLLFWEDGRFVPAGYIHAGCAGAHFETTAIVDRLRHFTPDLTDADLAELEQAMSAAPP